jgi:hypothetical protein
VCGGDLCVAFLYVMICGGKDHLPICPFRIEMKWIARLQLINILSAL